MAEAQTPEGSALRLRSDAERLTAALPPLLADAERLAATLMTGDHGRKRAGNGETFWQYRRAEPGDPFTDIDWRRSARSDRLYVRQTEWEAAQTVSLWVDPSEAMTYAGNARTRTKGERAALLALALAVVLNRGGERFRLIGSAAGDAKRGKTQLEKVAAELMRETVRPDYGAMPLTRLEQGSRAVFLSDFLGPRETLIAQVAQAADQGVAGCLVQVMDETEETFPFDGRTKFESMAGALKYETDRARALKPAYQARIAERQAELKDLARRTGWLYLKHFTNESPRKAMLWLYAALEGFKR